MTDHISTCMDCPGIMILSSTGNLMCISLHGSEGKIYFALTWPSRDKIAIIPSCDRCGCCSDVRPICRLHSAYTHKRAHAIKQYFSLLFCKVRKSD